MEVLETEEGEQEYEGEQLFKNWVHNKTSTKKTTLWQKQTERTILKNSQRKRRHIIRRKAIPIMSDFLTETMESRR